MPYNTFTIDTIRKSFGIGIREAALFPHIEPVPPSEILERFLARCLPLGSAIGTEKARSEFIIAPILAELTDRQGQSVSLFSGVEFTIDEERGLAGRCDFLISASPVQYTIEVPVLAVVEAKGDNINSGLGQCMAQMIAARIFNENEGTGKPAIYGSVTTGSVWRFLRLKGDIIHIDKREHFIDRLDEILGILVSIVSA